MPFIADFLCCPALQFYKELLPTEITCDFLWCQRLAPVLDYLPAEQREVVRAALAMGFAAHQGQLRKSGEPFITHPVEVARILAELHVDFESLIAGGKQGLALYCGMSPVRHSIAASLGDPGRPSW